MKAVYRSCRATVLDDLPTGLLLDMGNSRQPIIALYRDAELVIDPTDDDWFSAHWASYLELEELSRCETSPS